MHSRVLNILALLWTAACVVFAQNIDIGVPAANTSVQNGGNLIVRVDKPDTLTGSTDIGIAITLAPCHTVPHSSSTSCLPVADELGEVLYSGPYVPTRVADPELPPYQNFTVAIPKGWNASTNGRAVLTVVHSVLIGAGPFADTDMQNVTISIH